MGSAGGRFGSAADRPQRQADCHLRRRHARGPRPVAVGAGRSALFGRGGNGPGAIVVEGGGMIAPLALLVWDSPHLWPLAAAVTLLLGGAILWLYPAQVRPIPGAARWFPPMLRLAAVAALAVSLLKPAIVQP